MYREEESEGQQGEDKERQRRRRRAHLCGTQDELVHKFSLTRLQLLKNHNVNLLILSGPSP